MTPERESAWNEWIAQWLRNREAVVRIREHRGRLGAMRESDERAADADINAVETGLRSPGAPLPCRPTAGWRVCPVAQVARRASFSVWRWLCG